MSVEELADMIENEFRLQSYRASKGTALRLARNFVG